MMMALDSTSNDPALSKESVSALEAALHAYLADENSTAALEPAMRRIAAEAREKRIRAEQLLIMLKEVWYAIPQLEAVRGDTQTQLLQRVVTLCIREYYSG